MVSTSKVLTVSYGTFSCTLEGFDDSFETMKAIAEYFRDLAADDRYFGAEPPTPDAEMMARIAEREVSRRVEAHQDGSNFVLRTAQPTAALAQPSDAATGANAKALAAKAEAEAEAKAQAEAEAKAQADKAKAEAEARAQAAKEQADAEAARAKSEQLKKRAQDQEAATIDAERAARLEAEKAAAEQKAQAEKANAEAEAEAKVLAEAEAARQAEAQAEAQAKAEAEAEAEAKRQADELEAAEARRVAEERQKARQERRRIAAERAAEQEAAKEAAEAEARADAILSAGAPQAEAATTAPKVGDAEDSVAAKLARIRAVVGGPAGTQGTSSTSARDYSEDEHADDIQQGKPGDTDLADLSFGADQPDEDLGEESDDRTIAAQSSDAIGNVMSRLAEHKRSEDSRDADDAQADAQDARAENRPSDGGAQAVSEVRAEEELPQSEAIQDPVQEVEPEMAQEPEQPPASERSPLRARVIKMKRAEFEAAIKSGEIEEDEDGADDAAETAQSSSAAPVSADSTPAQPVRPVRPTRPQRSVAAAATPPADAPVGAPATTTTDAQPAAPASADAAASSSLSLTDEEELMRELAAVEAELSATPETAVPTAEPLEMAPDAPAPARAAAADARQFEELPTSPESEVDRLMNRTQSHLQEPEGKQRRNAMGHLRAAVAAARADKTIEPGNDTVSASEPYRSDLDSVVRPAAQKRPSAETGQAPAPLKLVAEQRVDLPSAPSSAAEVPPVAPAAAAPVRPRRVRVEASPAQPPAPKPAAATASGDDASLAIEGTFEEFAEEMGATELPDLLEAAAAYLAYVEGKDQFSRPQLMTKVRMVQEEDFSREDGLRSFGQLLRQGKIEKISGGRFTVSDRISFKPEARAAG